MQSKLFQRARTPRATKAETALLDKISADNQQHRAQRKLAAVPEVGIFFVYGGHLWVDGTPLDRAGHYGDFKIHDKGHDTFWEELQRAHAVPLDVEYDEVPRGRVAYDTKKRTFNVFADKCIRKDEHMVDKVYDLMHLPGSASQTMVRPDSHYRCPGCTPRHKMEEW
jgi:hypothetical protein